MPDEFTDPGKEIKERGRNICFLIQMPLTNRGERYFDKIS